MLCAPDRQQLHAALLAVMLVALLSSCAVVMPGAASTQKPTCVVLVMTPTAQLNVLYGSSWQTLPSPQPTSLLHGILSVFRLVKKV